MQSAKDIIILILTCSIFYHKIILKVKLLQYQNCQCVFTVSCFVAIFQYILLAGQITSGLKNIAATQNEYHSFILVFNNLIRY